MDAIKKIKTMETNYQAVGNEIQDFTLAIEQFEAMQEKIKILSDYYGSEEWFEHVKLDQDNCLPPDMPTSVLGEDYPYQTLSELRNIAIKMLELSTQILKM